MNLIPYKNPFRSPSLWHEDFFKHDWLNDMVSDRWIGDVLSGWDIKQSTYPKVNLSEDDKTLTLEATVPGLTKDQVSVEYENGVLTLKGEKQEKRDSYLKHEIYQKSFSRSFSIPEDYYSVDDIDCKLDNGLLSVTVPKKAKQKTEPKKLTIN